MLESVLDRYFPKVLRELIVQYSIPSEVDCMEMKKYSDYLSSHVNKSMNESILSLEEVMIPGKTHMLMTLSQSISSSMSLGATKQLVDIPDVYVEEIDWFTSLLCVATLENRLDIVRNLRWLLPIIRGIGGKTSFSVFEAIRKSTKDYKSYEFDELLLIYLLRVSARHGYCSIFREFSLHWDLPRRVINHVRSHVLGYAVVDGHLSIFQEVRKAYPECTNPLLQSGWNLTHENITARRWNVLHECFSYGHFHIVRELLTPSPIGWGINIEPDASYLIVEYFGAVINKNSIECLRDMRSLPFMDVHSLYHCSFSPQFSEQCREFPILGKYAVFKAASKGNVEMLQDYRSSPSSSPFGWGIRDYITTDSDKSSHYNDEANRQSDPEYKKRVLTAAIENGHAHVLRELHENWNFTLEDLKSSIATLLDDVVRFGRIATLEEFKRWGLTKEYFSLVSKTSIEYAARYGYKDVVKFFQHLD